MVGDMTESEIAALPAGSVVACAHVVFIRDDEAGIFGEQAWERTGWELRQTHAQVAAAPAPHAILRLGWAVPF